MKKVIVTASNFGYWGSELVMPLLEFQRAGIQYEIATQTGEKPLLLGASVDPNYFDPALKRTVTDESTASLVTEVHAIDPQLNNPIKINDIDPTQYDALCMVGGSGTLLDMVNNRHLHKVIQQMVREDKLVGAICYAVAALAYCRAEGTLHSIIQGKKVTGHNIQFDYTDAMITGFAGTDLLIPGAPYPLEYVLRDAVAPTGEYIGNYEATYSVVVDYPFLTARSTQDSVLFGHKFVEYLYLDPQSREIEVLSNIEGIAA